MGWGQRVAQTASMAGDPAMAFDRDALKTVLQTTAFGYGVGLRICLSAFMIALAILMPARTALWSFSTLLGGVILAAFAWTGHGAAEDGTAGLIHAANDVLHLIAAGVWLGALVALIGLTRSITCTEPSDLWMLHRSLTLFSGIGSMVVAVLVATGLVNSWFLVGFSQVPNLLGSQYGVLLVIKLGLFVLMLLLAAANRFYHTPRLECAITGSEPLTASLQYLQRSVWLEALLAFGVIVLVSALDMLPPPAAEG
jgi:putative copper resistance protein D